MAVAIHGRTSPFSLRMKGVPKTCVEKSLFSPDVAPRRHRGAHLSDGGDDLRVVEVDAGDGRPGQRPVVTRLCRRDVRGAGGRGPGSGLRRYRGVRGRGGRGSYGPGRGARWRRGVGGLHGRIRRCGLRRFAAETAGDDDDRCDRCAERRQEPRFRHGGRRTDSPCSTSRSMSTVARWRFLSIPREPRQVIRGASVLRGGCAAPCAGPSIRAAGAAALLGVNGLCGTEGFKDR